MNMTRTALITITALILAIVVAPLYVYGSPEVSNAVKHVCLSILAISAAATVIRRNPPRGLPLAMLLALSLPLAAMAEYKPGDRVTVIDGAGERFVADIVGTASNGWYQVAIDGEPYTAPKDNIAPAGWLERLGSAFTEKTQRVKTYGSLAAGVGGLFLASQAQVASDKDTDQINASDAATIARTAEVSALVNGPSTPERYIVTGTFVAQTPILTANGQWFPSITFGGQRSGFLGGDVVSATAPPSAVGADAQVILGGTWTLIGANEINIDGTFGQYTGRATISLGGLVIKGVRYAPVSGASIQLLEVQP